MDKEEAYQNNRNSSQKSFRRIILVLFASCVFLLTSCGGPSVCDCQAEAAKENPDREYMADCEELYKGKSFEEIEAELKECQE